MRQEAKLYIIGVGCGDTDLITRDALSAMAKADLFVCTGDIASRFRTYMGGKPVLFDPLMTIPNYYRKMKSKLTEEEIKKTTDELRVQYITQMKEALKAGKTSVFSITETRPFTEARLLLLRIFPPGSTGSSPASAPLTRPTP